MVLLNLQNLKPLATIVATLLSGYASCQSLPSVADLKKMSLEQLMDLEVTSVSKHPEKITTTSSAIQVITKEDIRQSGATSVAEALRLAPNLQVAQVNASQWAITARGFNNVLANKLLVLIDGRVVYTPMYAGVFWDVQNLVLEDIERIEVISGPGGTLWGANAVNGVINIITKSAKDTQGLFAEVAAGTELRGLASLRYGGTLGSDLSYRIYGTAFKHGNTLFRDSTEADDDWQMAQGGVRLDWDADDKDAVMFQANLYDGRPDPDGGHPVIARGYNILGRWNRTISNESGIQLQLFYDDTWRDFRNDFAEKLRTYDIEGQHRFRLARRHEIIYGLGFRFMDHEVQNLELFGFQPAHKSLYVFNVFLQDEITLIEDRLRLSLGTKLENNVYSGFQHQPSARINWTPSSVHTVWGAVSRALRSPSRIDRDFFIGLTPELDLVRATDFQSAELLAYELGWRLNPRENFSFSLATFYNEYDNIRSVEPGPPPFGVPLTFGNGVKGKSYGAELAATCQVGGWWRLRAGYTYFQKELTVKPGSMDANNGTAESNDPAHQFVVQSSMNLPGDVEFGTVLRYVSELPSPRVLEYFGLDVRLAWKINKNLELSVVGQNLAQAAHTEFIPTSPAAKDIERSVYGKVAFRL